MYTAGDWCYPQNDFLWRNIPEGRFPCPSGWRIPSSSDWGSIYREGGSYGSPAQATANKWAWKSGTTATGQGSLIQPDGKTTTLFLPAAGYRNASGPIGWVGTRGAYWASSAAPGGGYHLNNGIDIVSPEQTYNRAGGISVRCVAE
jgi:uncharacterized protein (TIGR02145 family)